MQDTSDASPFPLDRGPSEKYPETPGFCRGRCLQPAVGARLPDPGKEEGRGKKKKKRRVIRLGFRGGSSAAEREGGKKRRGVRSPVLDLALPEPREAGGKEKGEKKRPPKLVPSPPPQRKECGS